MSATNAREMFLGLHGKEASHSFARRGNITSNNVSSFAGAFKQLKLKSVVLASTVLAV